MTKQGNANKTMAMFLLLAVFLLTMDRGCTQSAHTHCSYMEDNLFTCDYTAMSSASHRPIDYNSFNPEPQRIQLTLTGIVPYIGDSQVFSTTFENIDVSQFNGNYPAQVVIDCEGATVLFFEGAFANMSHVQHLTIRNCDVLDLPRRVFADFVNLDHFKIEGGNIYAIDANAFVDLNVEKLTTDAHTIPRNLGRFEIQYTQFPDPYVPAGLLYNMKNLSTAILRGTGIDSLSADVFRYNTKLKHIDISDNNFTSIPTSVFDNLNALTEVRMENIEWECTCSNAWFVTYTRDKNITLHGDFTCSNSDGTVFDYYHSNCIDTAPCDGIVGFVIGQECQTVIGLITAILAIIACVITVVALVIIITSIKTHKTKEKKRRQAVGRWNQVIDRTIARSKKI